ncbi:transporter substrate-binding domain-containing protein [Shimia sp. R10_1]|uniref:substrate-binding periplasmic protein n=1 Tax=Shimia sp. R10_1 TaxID=2821095 RepID=UPI001ADA157F|nr:transporter substrate-binding domain-containing protein [Shimia sp. R10_1]MBO9473532.1 transporter substrate-binding domain-containing protein [Shimia sp. R10_1]
MNTKSTLAVASTLAMLTAGVASPALAETTLRVYADEYHPVYYLNDAEEVAGPAADIIREAAARAGVTVEFEYRPLKRALAEVEKTANVCFIGLWHTEEREDRFAWAGNIFTDGYAIFAKEGSGISIASVEDSFAYTTGVTAGWGSTEALRAAGHPKLQEVTDDLLNVKKLAHGRVDLWVSGTLSGPHAASLENIAVEQVLALQEVPLDFACNLATDPDAVSGMAAAITDLRNEGRTDELLSLTN